MFGIDWFLIHETAQWTIRLIMLPVILRRRLPPQTATAWLAIIFFMPELGLVGYLIFGGTRTGRKRISLHRKVIQSMRSAPRMAGQQPHIATLHIEKPLVPVVLQAEHIGGMPILGGNDADFIPNSDDFIKRLIADIDSAQHDVHLLFYIIRPDQTTRRVLDAMVRARKRGVTCRVMADSSGSRPFLHAADFRCILTDAGIICQPMLPVAPWRGSLRFDLRNHRKLAIIDGRIGYSGSQNLTDADYGFKGHRWIDLMTRLTGPVVAQLQIVFMEDWAFETGEVLETPDILPPLAPTGTVAAQTVATGPSETRRDTLPRIIVSALNAAQKQVIITSPYFVPDEPTLLALNMAAERGVEVNLVVPRDPEQVIAWAAARAFYEQMLESNVNIYLHHPGLLHAKTLTVDSSLALCGSANMDIRSFYLNFECSVLFYGETITHKLRLAQAHYIAQSHKLTRQEWEQRPHWRFYADNAAALLSPLL